MKSINIIFVALLICAGGCTQQTKKRVFRTSSMRPSTRSTEEERKASGGTRKRAQEGDVVGDVAISEEPRSILVKAEGIVIDLEDTGVKTTGNAQRQVLAKQLVQDGWEVYLASHWLNGNRAAAVLVEALIPPFARKGDKVDARVRAHVESVNLENGSLVGVDLHQYIKVAGEKRFGWGVTRSGEISGGVEARARGMVTLCPGYADGKRLGSEIPNVGYVPGGVLVRGNWAHKLILKKPDAPTASLIRAAVRARFAKVPLQANKIFVAVGIPDRYRQDWKRYIELLKYIPLRLRTSQEKRTRIAGLIASLGNANPRVRFDAECELDAIGPDTREALRGACRSSSTDRRQSALRVLAYLGDVKSVSLLVAESRVANPKFRRESVGLLSILATDEAGERLVEMLRTEDSMTRYEALQGLIRMKYKGATDIETHYSLLQRNFIMYRVEVDAGEKAVIIKSRNGIRQVVLLGSDIKVRPGFSGRAGMVTLSVKAGFTEIHQKKRRDRPPTRNLDQIVRTLDVLGVSVDDIIGLLHQMEAKGALNAKVYWTDK